VLHALAHTDTDAVLQEKIDTRVVPSCLNRMWTLNRKRAYPQLQPRMLQLLYLKKLFDIKAADRNLALENKTRQERNLAFLNRPEVEGKDLDAIMALFGDCNSLLQQSAYNVRAPPHCPTNKSSLYPRGACCP